MLKHSLRVNPMITYSALRSISTGEGVSGGGIEKDLQKNIKKIMTKDNEMYQENRKCSFLITHYPSIVRGSQDSSFKKDQPSERELDKSNEKTQKEHSVSG